MAKNIKVSLVLKFSIIFVLLLFITGCAVEYDLATKQEQVYAISSQREVRMGHNLAKEVEKRFEKVADVNLQQRVQDLGQRVVSVSDRKDITYYFKVLNNDEANAFALPGGYVYIFSGLLKSIENDSEIAAILGHEIAHIAARHTIKRLQASLGYDVFMLIAINNAPDAQTVSKINAGINELALAYSRTDEMDADRLAARYIKKAGFTPEAVLTFLEKLKTMKWDEPLRKHYLRTHPYLDDRIRVVKEELFGVFDFKDYINKIE